MTRPFAQLEGARWCTKYVLVRPPQAEWSRQDIVPITDPTITFTPEHVQATFLDGSGDPADRHLAPEADNTSLICPIESAY